MSKLVAILISNPYDGIKNNIQVETDNDLLFVSDFLTQQLFSAFKMPQKDFSA